VLRTLSNSIIAWTSAAAWRAWLVRYLATVIVMTSVIALCTLSPLQHNAWIIVVVAVLGCSWFGGVGPSILAPLILIMAVRFWQKDSDHVFDFSPKELADLVVFLLLTTAVGWSGQVRRRAQELANRQAVQLQEEAILKDRFLATLAHELRNPLAPLRTGLEILQLACDEPNGDESNHDPQVREVVDMMQRQVEQLVRLIDDLLDVSRINTGKIALRRKRVDLARMIRDAVDSSQPHMQAAGHQFDVTIAGAGLVLDADPARISQVLMNILNNAAKFTPRGGHIQLTAGRDGDMAEIRIRDNGIGIPSEMLPRVFGMFTQFDGSLERSRGGLGIGLGIAHTLVQMHSGSVSVHSAGGGQGCEFVVRLPLPPQEAGRQFDRLPSAASDDGTTRSSNILVADENT